MEYSKHSNINLTIRKRLVSLFAAISVIIAALIVRVGWIQLKRGSSLQKKAVEQWTNDVRIDAKRGKIIDRNGFELAVSASCERVDAYMRDILDREKEDGDIKDRIAGALAEILGDSKEYVLARLNKTLSDGSPINSVNIKRRIDKNQADKIRELKLPGIIVSEDAKRYYPNGNLLSTVLGFTNVDGDGLEGLEKKYDSYLKGLSGRRIMEADPIRREMPYNISGYVEPVPGDDIVLTIDGQIQRCVEKAIEDSLAENKASAVTAIVMDPKTGEILAMANKPDYDPNNPRDLQGYGSLQEVMKLWSNRAVTFTYEPGSIFKVVTASAALSEGLVGDGDKFTCTGSKLVGGRTIRCWRTRGHGTQTFAQILQNSCNVGFMILGERIGKVTLNKYIDAFGLGKPTGIDVNFEESGYRRPVDKIGTVELANISFGQGIVVTPIQMAAVFSAIANDGKMMAPHLVKRIQSTDEDGNITVIKEIAPKLLRQPIDADTSKEMRGYLEQVVSVGGGKKAYVEGYHIAGKTGTAQKVQNGVYAGGKYIASFLGMAPVDDPRVAIFLCIDEPDPSNYYAGQIAAPLAGRIFKDIFAILDMKADSSGSAKVEVTIPDVIGLSPREAESKLKAIGLQVRVEGSGKIVSDIKPKPGISLNTGSKVILYIGDGENYNNTVIVPNLDGRDVKEVSEILDSIGLKLSKSGDGYAVKQDPEVGEEVERGSSISVEFDIYSD